LLNRFEIYINALKKVYSFLEYTNRKLFEGPPDLSNKTDISEKILELDRFFRIISEALNSLKTLISQRLLLLTAIKSLTWHLRITIEKSENIAEIKERIKIFLIPEIGRLVNAFFGELYVIEEKIKPLNDMLRKINEFIEAVPRKVEMFKELMDFDDKTHLTIVDEVFKSITDENLENINNLMSKLQQAM